MNSPIATPDTASNQQEVVFPPENGGIGLFAISPPLVIGHKPQNDGAQGINIKMVGSDVEGLLAYLFPYLEMTRGDKVDVYLGDEIVPVANIKVKDEHFDDQGEAKPIPFHISMDDMKSTFPPLQPKNVECWFKIERLSGNSEESPRTSLCFLNPEPGEQDPDPAMPYNQGLNRVECSETIIDKTVVAEGLSLTVREYFNQSVGDKVVIVLGPLRWEITITALGDVVIDVTPEELASLPATNTLLTRWMVIDRVHNSSGWSDALSIVFKPLITLLIAPIFELADENDVVHHEKLVGAPLPILITGRFALNDIIKLKLTGFTKAGEAVSHTYTRTVSLASRSETFDVENWRVQNVIDGSLCADYELIKAGTSQFSKPANATVSGEAQPLGLPIVEPLVDNKVPVDTDMATVRVADYWPLKQGAVVKLYWQTTDQGGIPALFIFRQIAINPTQPIIFQVPAKYIAPYASTPLAVYCSVTNQGEVEVFSNLLQLMFGDAAQIVLEPPFPVPPATRTIDSLGALPKVRVEFLAAIAEDKARLVERRAPDGSPPFPLTLLNQDKRANFVLNREFLVARQGTSFQLHWNLNRDGERVASSESLALTVKPIAAEDPRLPTPEIEGTKTKLDVTTLLPTTILIVAEWLGQVSKLPVWLRYEEVIDGSTADYYDDRVGEPHQGPGLKRLVPLEWLKARKDGSTLKVSFWVNLDGKLDFATATLFPVKTYEVVNIRQGFEDWEGEKQQQFPPNQPITFNSGLTVTTLRVASNNSYSALQIFTPPDPLLGKISFLAHYNSSVRFSWSNIKVISVEFVHLHNSTPGNKITFYDLNNKYLDYMLIPLSDNFAKLLAYKPPAGQFIGSFVWEGVTENDSGIWIDNIKWTYT